MKRTTPEFAPGETASTIYFARKLYPYRAVISGLPFLFFTLESLLATYVSYTIPTDFLCRVFFAQLLAINAVMAGLLHFHEPLLETYRAMIPFPHPEILLSLTGFLLIIAGIGIAITATQRIAARLMVCLLIAMFPANIVCVVSEKPRKLLMGGSIVAALIRLPLQVPFILWSLWLTTPLPPSPF